VLHPHCYAASKFHLYDLLLISLPLNPDVPDEVKDVCSALDVVSDYLRVAKKLLPSQ
jgi:hypothetical protein